MTSVRSEIITPHEPLVREDQLLGVPSSMHNAAPAHPDMLTVSEEALIGDGGDSDRKLIERYTTFTSDDLVGMSATQIAEILLAIDDTKRELDEGLLLSSEPLQVQPMLVNAIEAVDFDPYPNKFAPGPWEERAYCANDDPEIPFNHEIEDIDEEAKRRATIIARKNCLECVVQLDCFTDAIQKAKDDGIHGGLTMSDRVELSKANPRGVSVHRLAETIGYHLRVDQNYVKNAEKKRLKAEQAAIAAKNSGQEGLQQIS